MEEMMMRPGLAEKLTITNTINKGLPSSSREHHLPLNPNKSMKTDVQASDNGTPKLSQTKSSETTPIIRFSDEALILSGIEKLKQSNLLGVAHQHVDTDKMAKLLS